MFEKYWKMTKLELNDAQKSQEFLAAKFDGLIKTTNDLKAKNDDLLGRNDELRARVVNLERQSKINMDDVEALCQYSRRDALEIQGIQFSQGENTSAIVMNLVKLIDRNISINKSDISTSHRLPVSHGKIPPIIVKFTRRDTRDKIYKSRRGLYSTKATDLDYDQDSSLYLNESPTRKSKDLLKEVKSFKALHNYKYIWTKYGKVYLKKNDKLTLQVFSFVSIEKFEEFKSRFDVPST